MNKLFNINEKSKIYVVCPANNKTGGTELLHQLVHLLNLNNKKAFITYYFEGKYDKNNPIPLEFKEYVSEYKVEKDIIDDSNNVLVLPEVCIGKNRKYKHIQKSVWWLSVDNYRVMVGIKNRYKNYGLKSCIKHIILNDYIRESDTKKINIHLFQSYFAKDFLLKKGIKENKMGYLSDYINDVYMRPFSKENRKNIVIYNPKKGVEFTSKLIKNAQDIQFVPIQNMTNLQVRELMNSAKVYIDFGNHPGKDRIPREAAMSGCCVLTNKRGSAGFTKDVPIADYNKFEDIEVNIPKIVERIKECFENYETEIDTYENYRQFISKEKELFSNDVVSLFSER